MRTRVGDIQVLAAGSLVSGLLAYAFFVIATRGLGATAAAPVSVLWTYWSFAAAALTFPLQHWIARSVAAHKSESAVHAALPRVTVAVTMTAVVAGVLAWLGRGALFGRDDVWFPVLVGVVTLGSGFIGVVRGSLAARERFRDVAGALVAENGVRCLAAVVLILAGAHASVSFGICLAAGSFVGFFWPSSLRFSPGGPDRPRESALAFLGGAAGGQLIGQAILTGGPVLLSLSGGSATEVTSLFAALALFRAPYTLGIGLLPQLTGRLTRLVVARDRAAMRRVRLAINGSTAAAVVVSGAVGALLAPWLLPRIFGDQVQLPWLPSMLVAIGSSLALANLVTTVSIMAQGRSYAVLRAWVGALGAGTLSLVVLQVSSLDRTCWVFLVAESMAFVALALEEIRGRRRLTPGSAQGTPIS